MRSSETVTAIYGTESWRPCLGGKVEGTSGKSGLADGNICLENWMCGRCFRLYEYLRMVLRTRYLGVVVVDDKDYRYMGIVRGRSRPLRIRMAM